MEIPHSVLAASWIPFVIVLILLLLFSFFYIRYYQHPHHRDVLSLLICVSALVVAFLTSILLPIDIFIVSFMKEPNGQFKEWALNASDRRVVEDTILHGYYVAYCFMLAYVFMVLPFSYFFYEESDDEISTKSKCCSALKYSIGFLVICTILLLIGAFAVTEYVPKSPGNHTEWQIITDLFHDEWSHRGADALSFAVNSLSLIGMLLFIMYTAYGLSAWPMDLIKGRKNSAEEHSTVTEDLEEVKVQIQAILQKYDGRGRQQMSRRDLQRLDDLEEQKFMLSRRQSHLDNYRQSVCRCCNKMMRPFNIVLGVIFLLLEVLIVLSLVLSSIDKLLHSFGWRSGYVLTKHKLPNPIDITLVFAQKIFPLDYIILVFIVIYLLYATMSAIQQLGIRCCCIKMYKLRPSHTKPQGLMFMCFVLIFIVLAFNVFLYELTPQYSTYGSQHYVKNITSHHHNETVITHEVVQCTTEASTDDCTMTRFSTLLMMFFFKVWFFGVCYYWAMWLFILVVCLGFLVTVCMARRSNIEGSVDIDDMLTEDDEDDPLLRA